MSGGRVLEWTLTAGGIRSGGRVSRDMGGGGWFAGVAREPGHLAAREAVPGAGTGYTPENKNPPRIESGRGFRRLGLAVNGAYPSTVFLPLPKWLR